MTTRRLRVLLPALACVLLTSGERVRGDELSAVDPISPELQMQYADLQADWWNWAASIKTPKHPFGDATGENCDEGQQGDVWFLAGVFGEPVDETTVVGTADRVCVVPQGKAIFFPVLNLIFTNIGEDPPLADADLEAAVSFFNGAATDLKVTLDGKNVGGVKERFVSESGAFDLDFTANGIISQTPGTTQAADAGYYVLLEPPTPGMHSIEFEGAYVFTVEEHGFDFVFDVGVSYTLIVE